MGYVDYNGKTEKRDGIPVKIETTTLDEQGTTDSFFDHTYRPVPGGCEMCAKVKTEGDGWTNSTPACDHVNNGPVWVTAGHCINRESGNPVFQNSSSFHNLIGQRSRYISKGNGDAGLIEVDSTYADPTWSIASEDTDYEEYDWPIQGIVADSRIYNMVQNGEKARFQGRQTGRSHSTVLDYTWSDGSINVKIDHDSDGGDSGGVYYELDDDGAYMMGVHAWGAGTAASGNTMQYIEDTLGISV
jgi:hypothetical protein